MPQPGARSRCAEPDSKSSPVSKPAACRPAALGSNPKRPEPILLTLRGHAVTKIKHADPACNDKLRTRLVTSSDRRWRRLTLAKTRRDARHTLPTEQRSRNPPPFCPPGADACHRGSCACSGGGSRKGSGPPPERIRRVASQGTHSSCEKRYPPHRQSRSADVSAR